MLTCKWGNVNIGVRFRYIRNVCLALKTAKDPPRCDTAHKLAKEGKTVDLVEELPEILLGVSIFNRFTMMRELSSLGVKSHVRAKVLEIKEDGVAIAEEGGKNFLEADTILIATGFIADHETYERFGEMADEVYPIGDIVEAMKIYDAVQEGFLIGKEI